MNNNMNNNIVSNNIVLNNKSNLIYFKIDNDEYHIIKNNKISYCGKINKTANKILKIIDENKICLNCYGAQLNEEYQSKNELKSLFISSRYDNINYDFPNLIELRCKQELEFEIKNEYDLNKNKIKQESDIRRTIILLKNLNIKIKKKEKILKNKNTSIITKKKIKKSLNENIEAKIIAEFEISKKLKKNISGIFDLTINIDDKDLKSSIKLCNQLKQKLKATKYTINRHNCVAEYIDYGKKLFKVYEYKLNGGKKKTISKMTNELPLQK